jgi:hypothetical protein
MGVHNQLVSQNRLTGWLLARAARSTGPMTPEYAVGSRALEAKYGASPTPTPAQDCWLNLNSTCTGGAVKRPGERCGIATLTDGVMKA